MEKSENGRIREWKKRVNLEHTQQRFKRIDKEQ